jgi:uncharacterized protein (UPF0332 family)
MKTPESPQDLISLRIEQAVKTIEEVEQCLSQNLLALATNRIYYGMFYAMLSLALVNQYKSKKHLQIIGWFNKNFVHTHIFPDRFGQMVKQAFEARSNADYELDMVPTHEELVVMLADMKTFIYTIKAWLEANPAT